MKRTLTILLFMAALMAMGLSVEPLGVAASSQSSIEQGASSRTAPSPVTNAPVRIQANKRLTITLFMIVVASTMGIVIWAARRTRTSADFYTAGGTITATQNAFAITGDFVSAASFLGVSGLISLFGFDGLVYSFGGLAAFVTLLLLIAEPCRNLGKYTLGDVLSFRSSATPVRAATAVVSVLLCIFYLIAQMVGAGKLMELLLGVPYSWAILGVGVLMIVYVVMGGMIATTWVQIVKAGLLLTGVVVLFLLVAIKIGFNPFRLLSEITGSPQIQDWVQGGLLKEGVAKPGFNYGQRFLEPGLFNKNPWDQLSVCIAFLFGTVGMPHILMRFFTVPDAQTARKSVVVSMFLIGGFFIMTPILGFAAALFVSPQIILQVDKGGNMANLLLAQMMGAEIAPWVGDALLAFLCAVAFATILAVVSGLVLAAAGAIAHDFYVSLVKGGKAGQREQMIAARITSIAVSIAAILIAMASERQNVAHLATLAFAVSASGPVPAIVLSLFWKKMSTAGVCAALLVGTITALGLVTMSPNMMYPKMIAAGAQNVMTSLEKKQAEGQSLTDKETQTLKTATRDYENNKNGKSIIGLDEPLFPLRNPAIVSVPIGFAAAIAFALMFPSKREEEAFDESYVRQNTGIGMEEA